MSGVKNTKTRDPQRTVYALLPLNNGYSRKVLQGFLSYEPLVLKWKIIGGDTSGLDHIASRRDVGIVTVCGDDHLLNSPARIVNVSSRGGRLKIPTVVPDNKACGRMAANHLMELGYDRFFFLGSPFGYAMDRLAGIRDALAQSNLECRRDEDWNTAEDFHKLLRHLVPPAAVIAATDHIARRLIDECRAVGLRVPDHVAVMGFDNDDIFCECSRPTLTTVDTAGQKVGVEAARLMEKLLTGAPAPTMPILVPPGGVIARESTAKRSTGDPVVLRALQFISRHALEGLTIEQVARGIGTNVKTLQKRYQQHFRGSVKDEIRRVQIDHATRLLRATDIKVIDLAAECGINHAGRFSRAFRAETGLTPAAYRRIRSTSLAAKK